MTRHPAPPGGEAPAAKPESAPSRAGRTQKNSIKSVRSGLDRSIVGGPDSVNGRERACYHAGAMGPRRRIALLLALFGAACGLEDSRSALDGPRFREVSAAEGHRLLQRSGVVLVQAIASQERGRPVKRAKPIAEDMSLPTGVADSSAVVVFAADPEGGLRLAARLARIGIQDVFVVRGGVAAWLAAGGEPPSG